MTKRGRPPKVQSSDEAMNIFPDAPEENTVHDNGYGELESDLPNPVDAGTVAQEDSFEEVLGEDFVNDTEREAPLHTKKTPSTLDGELPPTSREKARLPESLPATQEDIVGSDMRSIMNKGREHLLTPELIAIMEDKEEEGKKQILKSKGRFIHGQDDAKPGIPYSIKSPEYYDGNANLTPQRYINSGVNGVTPQERKILEGQPEGKATIRAEGVVLKNVETFDTGKGAQNKQTLDNQNKGVRSNNTFVNPDEDPLEKKAKEMQRRGDKNLKVSW